jgi:hypothetical protein
MWCILTSALLVGGCSRPDDSGLAAGDGSGEDTGAGSGGPPLTLLAAAGQVVGIETPTDGEIASAAAQTPFYPPGTNARFYLSAVNGDGSTTPMEQAAVSLWGGSPHDMGLGEISSGEYALIADNRVDFEYRRMGIAELDAFLWWEDQRTFAEVQMPWPPVVAVPAEHPAGQPLLLDFGGQGYQSLVALVFDANGGVTWSNDPASEADMREALQSTELGVFEVPASALSIRGTVFLGLAPCGHNAPQDLDGLDPALTRLRAGKMEFWKVLLY